MTPRSNPSHSENSLTCLGRFLHGSTPSHACAGVRPRTQQGPTVGPRDIEAEQRLAAQQAYDSQRLANTLVIGYGGIFSQSAAYGRLFGQDEYHIAKLSYLDLAISGTITARAGIPQRGPIFVGPRAGEYYQPRNDLYDKLTNNRVNSTESPNVNEPIFNPAGKARAEKFANFQQGVSLRQTIDLIAGDLPVITHTTSGKTLYTNPVTGKQVVYDNAGNYFRVEDTNVTGPLRYTDQFGNPIPNNVPLIKPTGVSQTGVPSDVRKALTHFTNSD